VCGEKGTLPVVLVKNWTRTLPRIIVTKGAGAQKRKEKIQGGRDGEGENSSPQGQLMGKWSWGSKGKKKRTPKVSPKANVD